VENSIRNNGMRHLCFCFIPLVSRAKHGRSSTCLLAESHLISLGYIRSYAAILCRSFARETVIDFPLISAVSLRQTLSAFGRIYEFMFSCFARETMLDFFVFGSIDIGFDSLGF
jgi:hypothetical protein